IGVAENIKAFRIGLHQPVLNPVVHHLDKVACPGRPTVDVALLRGADQLFPARCAWNAADSRRKRLEDWIKTIKSFFWPADHHAVAALQAPDTAAGANINIVNATVF